MSGAIAESRIGDFVQEKGRELPQLSNETQTVYEFDAAVYGEFRIIEDEIGAALDGAKHLPEVMIIGLISVSGSVANSSETQRFGSAVVICSGHNMHPMP
jgi:hypothetical protein